MGKRKNWVQSHVSNWIYRFYLESSREEDLHRNTLEALEQVPLITIRRFVVWTYQFMDTYA
ncbi:hypothetical protein BT96DRAFT_878495 [Gymnopus androsaceus JB14]|uniref:Uncharacterized protein n=1 Tax=Gymnopus androsaceus JB14 TaxID=1447944 RepID=A0A6A4HYK2_9AGAR|nr:hypothetical protein BT96DRAFT_878495 [Gymnopus androsaceus JB14]